MTPRPEFKQSDEVVFEGVRYKIAFQNPLSQTYNLAPMGIGEIKRGVEPQFLFRTYDAWKAANPDDPMNKPVNLLAWSKPPVAPRPQAQLPNPKTPDKFDYSQLAQDDQIAIRVQVSNIKTVMKRTAEGILTIGESLTDVQNHLAEYGHGKFQEWLKAEFEWSPRTAYRFIQVYKRLGVRANLAQMEIAASALYELADPETPDEVVDVVIDRAEAGEPIKRADVIEVKQAAAQSEVVDQVSPLNPDQPTEPAREENDAAPEIQSSTVEQVEIPPQIASDPTSPSESQNSVDLAEKSSDPKPAPTPLPQHRSETNEWYTPVKYLDAVREVLEVIDLDPASCEVANQNVKAEEFYAAVDDGFTKRWHGRVFLNPPYGKDEDTNESNAGKWAARLISAYESAEINEAILLVNASTGAEWFQGLWNYPICFVNGRISFINSDGEKNQPTHYNVFVYFGTNARGFEEAFAKLGVIR